MLTMQSPSMLNGDRKIPGFDIPKELDNRIPEILQACRDFGLDFYDVIVEILDYDQMAEIASYGGFPRRYPHWRFGMEYEEMSKGFEYGQYRIYEMVVNCIHPLTRLVTEKGSKFAKDVVAGDRVFARNGKRTVAKVVSQKASSLVKIRLSGQTFSLDCTKDHRWLTLKNNGPEWIFAKDIVPGDILLGGDSYNHFLNNPSTIEWSMDKILGETRSNVCSRVKIIHPPKQMTCDLAELLGIITGDGSQGVKSMENSVSVAIDKKQLKYISHVMDLFAKVFGIPSVVYNKPSVIQVAMLSKAAVDFIDTVGIPRGCIHKNKRVPASIWASSSEFRAAFIRGLFDTDGYCLDSLGFSSISPQLVSDVQLMLAEMGIKSKVTNVSNQSNNIWKLEIKTRDSKFKYQNRIGFNVHYKNNALNKMCQKNRFGSKGEKIPCLQNIVVCAAEKDLSFFPPEHGLARSLQKLKRTQVGFNCLYDFVMRAVETGCENVMELKEKYFSAPMYVVESVKQGDISETIDIALFDDEHDFMANGVISHNTDPCRIYNLASNTMVDHITVVAHATAHNDFFKNNRLFRPTNTKMLDELANHGTRIRRYMNEWEGETVQRFIDQILSLESLIDPAKAYVTRKFKEPVIWEKRKRYEPRQVKISKDQEFLQDWINTKEWFASEDRRIKDQELAQQIGIMVKPERDVFGFLKENAPLRPWQQDVISMIYEETMYFAPQGATKVINEGWASFVDSQIMARFGMAGDGGIYEYARHKAGVLGGRYSTNPYKLGYSLFSEIEDRWNKGRFGNEYDLCNDFQKKEKWDTKIGLGLEKCFDVRAMYDDLQLISEFFDQDFCNKYEFFEWIQLPDGSREIKSRDYNKIKKLLIRSKINHGFPDVRVVESNFRDRRILALQHFWDGRILDNRDTPEALESIAHIWNAPVMLLTKTKGGEEFCHYVPAPGEKPVATTVDKI